MSSPFVKLESGKPIVMRIVGYVGTKDGQYGPQHIYDVHVNGTAMTYTTTSNKVHTDLQANGAGNSVTIEKVFKDGKNFINVYPFSGTAQAAQKVFAQPEPRYVPDYSQDPQAQPDMRAIQMGRGACFNLAFQYVLQHHPELSMGSGFLAKVAEVAGAMETAQREFINHN